MKILSDFIHGFDFVRMTPDNSVIKGGIPAGGTARALVEPRQGDGDLRAEGKLDR